MSKQNIFDNVTFFDEYKKLRNVEANANNLFEIPALTSLLPNLQVKKVLDLGCGFGEHCKKFVNLGAEKVVGIDISSKMLEVAKQNNCDAKITYLNSPIEDISLLNETFDVVVSSLALHYVENFSNVANSVYSLLNKGGVFIFSQEHPLVTSHSGGNRWTRNENGEKLHLNLSNYGIEGERTTTWFVDNVKVYHRTFSNIVNTLIEAGFSLERMIEPFPTADLLEKYPKYSDLFHKPDFLLIKAKK